MRSVIIDGVKVLVEEADSYLQINEIGYEAALSIGFAVTGFYRGYVVKRTSHPVVQ